MEKVVRSILKSSYFTSGILILLGLLLFIKSDDTIVAISYLIGGVVIVLGVLALIRFFRNKDIDFTNSFNIIYGVITIVFGVFILSNPKMIASIIPVVIGIWVIIKSSFKIAYAMELKNINSSIWKNALIISILSALVGVFMLFNPFKTSVLVFRIIGAVIIVYAVLDIISTVQLKKSFNSYDDKNDDDISNLKNTISDNNSVDEDIVDAEVEEINDSSKRNKTKKASKKRKKDK